MKLIVNNDEVQCIGKDGLLWSIPVNDLVFIGEYTTIADAWLDDWFFVFAKHPDDLWRATSEAIDHETFWKELGVKLNCEIAPNLSNSIVWKTRVIYPKSLDDEELFTVIKLPGKPKTFWQRIFGGNNNEEKIELTDKVKALFVKN